MKFNKRSNLNRNRRRVLYLLQAIMFGEAGVVTIPMKSKSYKVKWIVMLFNIRPKMEIIGLFHLFPHF